MRDTIGSGHRSTAVCCSRLRPSRKALPVGFRHMSREDRTKRESRAKTCKAVREKDAQDMLLGDRPRDKRGQSRTIIRPQQEVAA